MTIFLDTYCYGQFIRRLYSEIMGHCDLCGKSKQRKLYTFIDDLHINQKMQIK